MGEARRKGNFEERKARAIEAGRAKGAPTLKQKLSAATNHIGFLLTPELLLAMLKARARAKRR